MGPGGVGGGVKFPQWSISVGYHCPNPVVIQLVSDPTSFRVVTLRAHTNWGCSGFGGGGGGRGQLPAGAQHQSDSSYPSFSLENGATELSCSISTQ